MNCAVPFAKDNLSRLVSNIASNAASNAINKFERRLSGKGAVRAERGFNLFISDEDINDIIRIIKSLEDSGVLIDCVTETVKHQVKKEGRFLAVLALLITSLVQPVIYSLVKGITGTGVLRAGTGYYNYMNKFF